MIGGLRTIIAGRSVGKSTCLASTIVFAEIARRQRNIALIGELPLTYIMGFLMFGERWPRKLCFTRPNLARFLRDQRRARQRAAGDV